MFNYLNSFKTLVVDLDSIDSKWDSEWKNICDEINILFCSLNAFRGRSINRVVKNAQYFRLPNILSTSTIDTVIDILRLSDLKFSEIVFLTSNWNICDELTKIPLNVIILSSGINNISSLGKLPDYYISNLNEINNIKAGKDVGYISEYIAANYGSTNDVVVRCIKHCYYNTYEVISGGRYFESKDKRSSFNALATRIIKSKRDNSQEDVFKNIYSFIIRICNANGIKIDGITRVPPRPTESNDRFKGIVEKVASENNTEDLCDNLICIRDYRKQKGLNASERKNNIIGVFQATDVIDKTILVIDDILTTGATTFEAVNELYRKGAKKVIVGVLATTQFKVQTTYAYDDLIICSKCNSSMKLRNENNHNQLFFGCSNYPYCQQTKNYSLGIKELLNNIDDCLNISEGEEEYDCEDYFDDYCGYRDPEADGLIYCSGDGQYHDVEDAWMYDGSRD